MIKIYFIVNDKQINSIADLGCRDRILSSSVVSDPLVAFRLSFSVVNKNK